MSETVAKSIGRYYVPTRLFQFLNHQQSHEVHTIFERKKLIPNMRHHIFFHPKTVNPKSILQGHTSSPCTGTCFIQNRYPHPCLDARRLANSESRRSNAIITILGRHISNHSTILLTHRAFVKFFWSFYM